jgi:hypothetical protein
MDSKKIDKEEKKSVQPPQKDMASGQKRETTFVQTTAKQERPLEERRVVERQEDSVQSGEKEPEKELDWALSKKRVEDGSKDEKRSQESQGSESAGRGRRQLTKSEERLRNFGRVGQWFQLLCFMHIPVFGFFYMLVMAVRKKTPPQKKSFARAYILYRILVLFLAVTILFVIYKVGLSFVEEILRYAHF